MKDKRMHNLKYLIYLIVVTALLVGCQPAADEPLPTQIDLNATNQALNVSQTETAAAPTATSSIPTLPPTFTPTVDVPPTETPIPTLDPNISPTPVGFRKDGTLYYIYNGDSIARVFPDGTLNEIIVTFGIDQPITDLTASPNGELLAFVAPSSGSAREVWVTNRDGSYLQQVSCLGFGEARSPAFAPDSNRIAFFAAPLATDNMRLYVADFAGSNDCPTGNNQQQLLALEATTTGEIAWNASANMIYYGAKGTHVYDFSTIQTYVLSATAGFGADFGVRYNLGTDQLLYLRLLRDLSTGEQGGAIVLIDEADTRKETYTIDPIRAFAHDVEWWQNEEAMLYATGTEITYFDFRSNRRIVLQQGLEDPQIAIGPRNLNYAYTFVEPNTLVTQISIADKFEAGDMNQVTINPEGTIENLLWLAG